MYYLCVLSIFKNEAMNIEEWLNHYLWQGVDHFYLINNGSTDNFKEIIDPYVKKGYITLYDLPKQKSQKEHYNYVFHDANLKEKCKWMIMCDLDEMIFSTGKDMSRNIREYLKAHETIPYILCSMFMFGSRDEYHHPKSIRKAFVYREKRLHEYGKYIIQPKYVQYLHVHRADTNVDPVVDDENLHLFHYIIQSKEYFDKIKKQRGDVIYENNGRDDQYFIDRDFREVHDLTLYNLLNKAEKDKLMEHFVPQNQVGEIVKTVYALVFLVALSFIIIILKNSVKI